MAQSATEKTNVVPMKSKKKVQKKQQKVQSVEPLFDMTWFKTLGRTIENILFIFVSILVGLTSAITYGFKKGTQCAFESYSTHIEKSKKEAVAGKKV